ncbi:MAG: GLPGLI family protein [Bacteroidota bacterium]|nr:GLPGLI family protein [Bacteroidota bacterium]MDP4211073.1 GLPGLI family protein [Bacteroidota bacterium]MDP4249192.1 GLPGLI family protein [Bacteroidota bacterium]
MRQFILSITALLLSCIVGHAQNTIFLSEGKIEFTRTVNLIARITPDDDGFSDLMKKTMPKFKRTYFQLFFSHNQWVYKPGRENPENNKLWEEAAETNVVSGDYSTGRSVSQKEVFGETFLIQDSLRRIRWKMTDETRDIAGFTCHRANALIMDSIYVVAFYTDEIVTPGGPESFSGLPGMILGISLPHQHITWFADQVEVIPITKPQLTPPTKGKKCNNAVFSKTLTDGLSRWGKYGRKYMEEAML